MTKKEAEQILIYYDDLVWQRDNHITCGMIAEALDLATEALSGEIPFKHKDIEDASHDKRFKSVWESVAFRLGAMWAVNKIYSDKTPAEILEEIEAPIVTCD